MVCVWHKKLLTWVETSSPVWNPSYNTSTCKLMIYNGLILSMAHALPQKKIVNTVPLPWNSLAPASIKVRPQQHSTVVHHVCQDTAHKTRWHASNLDNRDT